MKFLMPFIYYFLHVRIRNPIKHEEDEDFKYMQLLTPCALMPFASMP
ncbi:MAG: hypothetical protein K9I84_01725 [Leadbetterella sp.]|nr:hypothetical protein [Leadbetterella sp.]